LKKTSKEEQALSEKVTLFGNLPDACDVCQKSFDKKDKEMVFSWTVIVREEEESSFILSFLCREYKREIKGVCR